MTRRIDWSKAAVKDVRRLNRATANRIVKAVERFAETGQGDIQSLKGPYSGLWRLRVGNWRVHFTAEDETLCVLRVLPRGEAYKK